MFSASVTARELGDVDFAGYPARCENGVTLLAAACGRDVPAALAQFRATVASVSRGTASTAPANAFEQITRMVSTEGPLLIELVTTLSRGALQGFGFLTQGRSAGTLPDNLAALLAAALEHLLARGGRDEAVLLADLFSLAFPSLARLRDFSPLAQGMMVGIAPQSTGAQLKIYFNTRLDPTGDHAERVRGLLARLGLMDPGFYSLLYDEETGARFHGLGVDLRGDGQQRAKLYVHLSRAHVEAALIRVATLLAGNSDKAGATIVTPAMEMIREVAGAAAIDDTELAIALCSNRPPTAKLTLFFSSTRVSAADFTRVCAYLARLGYPTDGLVTAVTALNDNASRAVAQKHPLHGIGIEVPVGTQPKLNLYLQPVL